MTTIVKNSPDGQMDQLGDGSVVTLVVGIVIAVLVVFLFIIYGLPAMREV